MQGGVRDLVHCIAAAELRATANICRLLERDLEGLHALVVFLRAKIMSKVFNTDT